MSTINILHDHRRNNIIGKHIFDFEDGNFIFSMSDDVAIDTDGHLMMRWWKHGNGNRFR